jgi:hypothetical protein
MADMELFKRSNKSKQSRNFSASFALSAISILALSPIAQGVTPAPDGGYPGQNTAEGQNALLSLSGGTYNTALGWASLGHNVVGNFNTAVGAAALLLNTAFQNTAVGAGALLSNNAGEFNTANGAFALFSNSTGGYNTAIGSNALYSNNTGTENLAAGESTLLRNTTGSRNTASGDLALFNNATGSQNTANGFEALSSNELGNNNTAIGAFALQNSTGDSNTAVGYSALTTNSTGSSQTAVGWNALANDTSAGGLAANTAAGADALENNTTGGDNVAFGLLALVNNSTGNSNTAIGTGAGAQITGDNNIDIGSTVAGVAGESNTTRIGNSSTTDTYITGVFGAPGFGGNPVYSDADGKFYTVASSKRFKQDIKPMDNASEAMLALKPVTFRYKKDIDPTGTTQFGLVAEEVEKVNRDLVVRDKNGKTYSVRYDQVNAMLLNEFLKEHKKVEEQQTKIDDQEARIAELNKSFQSKLSQQHQQIETLASGLARVTAQLAISKPSLRTVLNDH